MEFHHVDQDGLNLLTSWSTHLGLPKCWDYRLEPPRPAVCTTFNSRIDQAEERISEVEDQLNGRKQEDKIKEKRLKRNEQSFQEIWDYVKRPRSIGVPECDKENESKLENILQDIIQENFPSLARQDNIQL